MIRKVREEGVIGAFNRLIADIDKARERGEDIGLREFDKIARENQIKAGQAWRRTHCLGPRDGATLPETATDWIGDPDIQHEPTTEQAGNYFHPACSCGFRAPLTSDTEEGALRRARVHAEVSTPRPDGRYVLTASDRPEYPDYAIDVYLYCRECRGPSLLRFTGMPDEHRGEIAAAVRDHDSRVHGGDA